MTTASELIGVGRTPKTRVVGTQIVDPEMGAVNAIFRTNDGDKHCESYSTPAGTIGTSKDIFPCKFDDILTPLPYRTITGVRVLPKGTILRRGEALEIETRVDPDDTRKKIKIKNEPYANFRAKPYLDEHHGLWFVANPKGMGYMSQQGDKYKLEVKYEVTKDIFVLWIPNILKLKSLAHKRSQHFVIGYAFVDSKDGHKSPFAREAAQWDDLLSNFLKIINTKYQAEVQDVRSTLKAYKDKHKSGGEERVKDKVQRVWKSILQEERALKKKLNIAPEIPLSFITAPTPDDFTIGGYAGCNECEIYLTTHFLRYLKAEGAEVRELVKTKHPGAGYLPAPLAQNPFLSSAYVSRYGMSYNLDQYDESDESAITENGYQFDYTFPEQPHVPERGTLSDRYYHEYGTYNYYTPDYVLLFAMGMMIFIGCCCLIIIISIIGGFISGKFYEMRKNQHSPSDRPKYEMVNENEDQI